MPARGRDRIQTRRRGSPNSVSEGPLAMTPTSDPRAPERVSRRAGDGRLTREILERQNFELTALLEIARGLLSAGDPGQAVGQFLLSCVAGVGASSAAGLRWEADRGRQIGRAHV